MARMVVLAEAVMLMDPLTDEDSDHEEVEGFEMGMYAVVET